MVLFSRCGGVSLAVRGCGLNRFLPPIILNVCVCVRKRACVNVDMSMYCPFKFQKCTFTLSYTHTCILPKLTQSVCRTPNHDYKLKCEELFFSFLFFLLFLVLLCFIHVHFISFFSWFSQDDGTPQNFMSCHKLGLHTLPRGTLVGKKKET